MTRIFLMVARLVLIAVPVALPAQKSSSSYPSLARGVTGDSSYFVHDIDTINMFNGNLSLQVPIGPTYPVGGNLNYGLNLTYNASAWDFDPVRCWAEDPPGPFRFFDFDANVPYRLSNAGMGWVLSLGRLFEPNQLPHNRDNFHWVYHGRDEGRRGLYLELHPGMGSMDNPPDTRPSSVLYTRDGSFMRMRSALTGAHNQPPGAPQNYQILEFGNGVFHEFHNIGTSSEPDWRPTHFRDAFGNFLDIDYQGSQWVLTDGHGRVQRIFFSDSQYGKVVRVELTRFGAEEPATYRFHYESREIDRHQYHRAIAAVGCTQGSLPLPVTLTVELLARLDLPDGSFYQFDYFSNDTEEDVQGTRIAKSGALRDLRLPTGLHYGWAYTNNNYSFFYEGVGERAKRVFNEVFGIRSKRKYALQQEGNAVVEVDLGTWNYEAQFPSSLEAPLDQVNPNDPYAPCYHRRDVVDPEGVRRAYYFQTARAGFAYQQHLPFSYCDPDTQVFLGDENTGEPGPGPFLSEELYSADGRRIRQTFLTFQVIPGGAFPFEKNAFPVLERSVSIAEDGNTYKVENLYSNYDGFGHRRQRTTVTDFPGSTGDRTRFTDYNPGRGSLDASGNGSLSIPAWSDPWILEVHGDESISQDGRTTRSQYCFDSDTGFLSAKRQLSGNEPSPNDVVINYEHDGFGNTNRETYFGGDGQNPGGDGNCMVDPSLQPVFEMVHGYAYGVRATSAYLDCQGNELLRVLDQSIDSHTGLVASSRDPSGVTTQYGYDIVGREVFAQTASMARIERTFLLADDEHPYRRPVYVERTCPPNQPQCNDDDSLSLLSLYYDWEGRLHRETVRLPNADGSGTRVNEQVMEYDQLGRTTAVRVWRSQGNGSNAAATRYFDYDALGRPGRIVNPDGSETSFVYEGEWLVERHNRVRGEGGDLDTVRREFTDGFGRLFMVEEQSGPGSGLIKTTYRYGENDRLVGVCVGDDDDRSETCPTNGQSRSFTYDGRGFLIGEGHPEWGGSVAATGTYSYDALGNQLSRDFPGTEFDLNYRYDRAGRVVQVGNDAGLWKEFFYGLQNVGGDRRAGKLVTAKRHNRLPSFENDGLDTDVVVTETFAYEGPGGLLSRLSLHTNQGALFQTDIDAYDHLGNVTRLSYPDCAAPGCLETPDRQVSYLYESGVLAKIPGFVSNFGYHPDGRLRTLKYTNGVEEDHLLDAMVWRLNHIQTTGISGGGDWHYGPYAYDDSGNITSIGTESFAYDRVNRMVHASIQTQSGVQVQDASFDIFGNMTLLENGESGPGIIELDTARNRLDAGTAAYDVAGNLRELDLAVASYVYRYDPFHQMVHLREVGGLEKGYLYTTGDERVAILDLDDSQVRWTLRGPTGFLLRRFTSQGHQWQWAKDYMTGAGRTLASVTEEGTLFFHKDHLGTSRKITDEVGVLVASHDYFPFGFYTSDPGENDEALRFTGHERDANGDPTGDLDYMLARYYQPFLGRFLSVDPVVGRVAEPQSWNRYAYVLGNPIRKNDPDGNQDQDFQPVRTFEESPIPGFVAPMVHTFALTNATVTTRGILKAAEPLVRVAKNAETLRNIGMGGALRAKPMSNMQHHFRVLNETSSMIKSDSNAALRNAKMAARSSIVTAVTLEYLFFATEEFFKNLTPQESFTFDQARVKEINRLYRPEINSPGRINLGSEEIDGSSEPSKRKSKASKKKKTEEGNEEEEEEE